MDIASLKIHSGPGTSYGFGGCSLCMKNHFGTFINQGTERGTGGASSTGLHSLDAVFSINKHATILGGNPVRQQLCIVDGLLADGGSSAVWSVRLSIDGWRERRFSNPILRWRAPLIAVATHRSALRRKRHARTPFPPIFDC